MQNNNTAILSNIDTSITFVNCHILLVHETKCGINDVISLMKPPCLQKYPLPMTPKKLLYLIAVLQKLNIKVILNTK